MALVQGKVAGSGELGLRKLRGRSAPRPRRFRRVSAWRCLKDAMPWFGLGPEVNAWRRRNMWALLLPILRLAVLNQLRAMAIVPTLHLKVLRGDGSVLDLGLASMKVVTTAGVGYIVDAFQNSVELENMKYHGFGTGTGAEASSDTALGTELTTEYATDNTRPTGTQGEGSGANVYRTVATLSPDSGGTLAITEHGIFSQAANSGGVLLDRSKFSAVNLVAGSDSLQATYDHTQTAGS